MDIVAVSILMCRLTFSLLGCSSDVSHDATHVLCVHSSLQKPYIGSPVRPQEPGRLFSSHGAYLHLLVFHLSPSSLSSWLFPSLFSSPLPLPPFFLFSLLPFCCSYSHSCLNPISPGNRLWGRSCIDNILTTNLQGGQASTGLEIQSRVSWAHCSGAGMR